MYLNQDGGRNSRDFFKKPEAEKLEAHPEIEELAAQLETLCALWAAIKEERQILAGR